MDFRANKLSLTTRGYGLNMALYLESFGFRASGSQTWSLNRFWTHVEWNPSCPYHVISTYSTFILNSTLIKNRTWTYEDKKTSFKNSYNLFNQASFPAVKKRSFFFWGRWTIPRCVGATGVSPPSRLRSCSRASRRARHPWWRPPPDCWTPGFGEMIRRRNSDRRMFQRMVGLNTNVLLIFHTQQTAKDMKYMKWDW